MNCLFIKVKARLQEPLVSNEHPKAQTQKREENKLLINGDQFLHSFMPRTMRDLRAE